jgi:putative heme-binding domain-containing protein
MAEVGYRYDELVTASKNRNWDYAQYQTEKIDHTIRLGLERRPKRANSAQPFLNEIVPPLVAAIKAKRPEQLDLAVTNLHRGCIQCHRAENVLYMSERFASIHPTPEATIAAIEDYKRLLTPEYLASADLSQGRLVYSKHCGSCHRMFEEGGDIGPALTNLQRSNLDYLLKATVDPNSLIGFDYQTEVIVTKGGRVISGLVKQEGEDFVTIQTATDAVKVTRDEIEERAVSAVSLMPERLLQNLSSEQVRDLIAYLQGAKQVSLPVGQPE